MSGVQTISYELHEQLPTHIDSIFCPAGGGGLALAVARGFTLLVDQGRLKRSPEIHCVQPEGNDTIASALRDGNTQHRRSNVSRQLADYKFPTLSTGTK